MDQTPSLFPSIEVVMSTISALGPMTSPVRMQSVNSMKVPPGHHDTTLTTTDFKGLMRSWRKTSPNYRMFPPSRVNSPTLMVSPQSSVYRGRSLSKGRKFPFGRPRVTPHRKRQWRHTYRPPALGTQERYAMTQSVIPR